jgi:diadenosine tetraphosphatase ApaH/serine/threonine PP2A family protein phosphatase
VSAVWCLGDTVGYNAQPGECLALVRSEASILLLGNHDYAVATGDTRLFNPLAEEGARYSRRQLGAKDFEYLASLAPKALPEASPAAGAPRILLCHASPDDPLWEYVDEPSGRYLLGRGDLPELVLLGHTHSPFHVRRGTRAIVNVGSVGQPRDGDPRACFVVLDTDTAEIEFHRVDYDIEAEAAAIRAAGLPGALAERLFVGR